MMVGGSSRTEMRTLLTMFGCGIRLALELDGKRGEVRESTPKTMLFQCV